MIRGFVRATYPLTTSLNGGDVGTSEERVVFRSTAVTCSSLSDAGRLVVSAFAGSPSQFKYHDQEPPL